MLLIHGYSCSGLLLSCAWTASRSIPASVICTSPILGPLQDRRRSWLDFAVLALDGPRFATGCCAGCSSTRGCTRLTVDLLANALHRALQVIGCGAHTREITARKRSAHGLDLVLHLAAQARRDPVTDILQCPFGLVRQAIGTVARLNLLAALAVLLRVQFGFAHHALDLLLGE